MTSDGIVGAPTMWVNFVLSTLSVENGGTEWFKNKKIVGDFVTDVMS